MTFWMMMLARQIARAPDGGAGGAAGDPPPAGAGDPPPAGAGTPPPAGAGDPPPAGNGGAAKNWWEADTISADERQWLTARGLADADKDAVLIKAIKGHRHAEQRLGNRAEDLLTKPKEGQSVTEWLAEQRDKLGLPDKVDGYKIDAPQDWPKDVPWDTDMAAKVKELAFQHGAPPEMVNAFVGVYAEKVLDIERASAKALATATETMMRDLQRDWGDQTQARITQAKQAAGVMAERAGLDGEALQNLTSVLSDKIGDANVLRLFASIAEGLGDDAGVAMGKGATQFTMTPADARAEIARLSAPDGEYAKVLASNDMPRIAEMNKRMSDLTKLASKK